MCRKWYIANQLFALVNWREFTSIIIHAIKVFYNKETILKAFWKTDAKSFNLKCHEFEHFASQEIYPSLKVTCFCGRFNPWNPNPNVRLLRKYDQSWLRKWRRTLLSKEEVENSQDPPSLAMPKFAMPK